FTPLLDIQWGWCKSGDPFNIGYAAHIFLFWGRKMMLLPPVFFL
ncbi:MAG: hypothetical protein ACJA0M_000390, partial [Chitinophagales bacterium]